jgi:hypothetical protein
MIYTILALWLGVVVSFFSYILVRIAIIETRLDQLIKEKFYVDKID